MRNVFSKRKYFILTHRFTPVTREANLHMKTKTHCETSTYVDNLEPLIKGSTFPVMSLPSVETHTWILIINLSLSEQLNNSDFLIAIIRTPLF